MGKIFISYRREDTEGQARALLTDLEDMLGAGSTFMDVDSISLGRDFRLALQESLATCSLMIVLIGKDWLAKNEAGQVRLENPDDFVRLEVGAALRRNIPVTPVLVRGARMPRAEDLPEELKDLSYRNGFELSHNRWNSDVQELIKRLGLRPTSPSKGTSTDKLTDKRLLAVVTGACVFAIAVAVWVFIASKHPADLANAQAPELPRAPPATSESRLNSFVSIINGSQRDVWVRQEPNKWIDIGPTGNTYYVEVGRYILNNCAGSVVKSTLRDFWGFFPDKGCPGMPQYISSDLKNWGQVSQMTEVQ
jgi:hypothetical protein